MPTYTYRREDGTTFETQQRITDEALETCPETGQPVERIIAGQPGVIVDSSPSDAEPRPPQGSTPGCPGGRCGL
jgi:putative FmdB family regulatory protein